MASDSTPSDEERPSERAFPIVGIGASAGGLEALSELVKQITLDHIALVIVQHLSPSHTSMLPELLGRVTEMKVVEIVDGARVVPNHVYVAPPRMQVRVSGGALQLGPAEGSHSIDVFLRSLAQDHGRDAIGIVLSGMGSDGSLGLKAIKERGGITFVQSPSSAKFEAMPLSAIVSDVADRVLTPGEIGAELMAISRHPYLAREASPVPPAPSSYGKVFGLIRAAFGNDLTHYKQTTIQRRLERRMAIRHVEDLEQYVGILRSDAGELAALYQDVLINVTSFFRDRDPFEMLRTEVFPRLIAQKEPGDSIRIWVPACATGEEAYGVGICLLEALEARAAEFRIQIFGTDVDVEAIEQARRAVYKGNIDLDVSPERLSRFFQKIDGHYQVQRRLRDLLVFSIQSVTTDAPFSKLDLVSCRNLLIYMQPVLQKRVLRIFHYALKPDALLLLGTSETVGDSAELFSLIDRKNKLYSKKNLPTVVPLGLGRPGPGDGNIPPRVDRRPALTVQHLADRKVLDRYAPPSVLLDESLDVLHFRGDTGHYLAPSSGVASLNILRLVRPELTIDLGRSLDEVRRSNQAVRAPPTRMPARQPGDFEHLVSLEVVPLADPQTQARCLLVLFHEVGGGPAASSEAAGVTPAVAVAPRADDSRARERELEEELVASKEYLQTAIEELQSANEELKSTNEELQSSNEELQSTNEELETSKEELRATNEELSTVNLDMNHRLSTLSDSASDLGNWLRTAREPTVFVDADGRIRRYTNSAADRLGLSPGDEGRPLAVLRDVLPDADLPGLVNRATTRVSVAAAETRSTRGHWYALTATPYMTASSTIAGALIAFEDIDARKRDVALAIDVKEYAEKLLSAIPHPLAVVDKDLRVLWVNASFLDYFRVSSQGTIDNLLTNLGNGQWAHPKLRDTIQRTLDEGTSFRAFRIEHAFEAIGPRSLIVSGNRILGVGIEKVVLISMEELGETEAKG
jgi:two-component system, chemotaxis family, CheB/CheR fusion protein